MNFAAMLAASVTPLSKRIPSNSVLPKDVVVKVDVKVSVKKLPKSERVAVPRPKGFNGTPFSPSEARQIKSNRTYDRYKRVMALGKWMTTQEINHALRRHRMTAVFTLSNYRTLGIVERELIGNFVQQGYKWRWLDTSV